MKNLHLQILVYVMLLNFAFAWFFDTPDIHGQRRKGLTDSQMRGSAEGLFDGNDGEMEFKSRKRNAVEDVMQHQDKLNEALSILLHLDEDKDGVINLKELYYAVTKTNGPILQKILEK